jgi:hydrogenase/urease accessory protein HupE
VVLTAVGLAVITIITNLNFMDSYFKERTMITQKMLIKKTLLVALLASPSLAFAHAGHDHHSVWADLIHLLSNPDLLVSVGAIVLLGGAYAMFKHKKSS